MSRGFNWGWGGLLSEGHRSRHQQFGYWAEMGFHGYALELHWVWSQELGGVYWKRERSTNPINQSILNRHIEMMRAENKDKTKRSPATAGRGEARGEVKEHDSSLLHVCQRLVFLSEETHQRR
ncbi:hypothetical protein EYF80_042478 [Liparis tanakae]|uniref:Uncharacterized protein n=1 Tax=Liparis tanakae TaxID=230148 RepID=A0A4Z2G178_9TELE|nr:hypothetical protein EYF80_042478 [Liparis tanakae]